MVRINLIHPHRLSDQHLIAEYNEMLMLIAYIRRYPELHNIPSSFTLNKGHMSFFRDKVGYIAKRHESLKQEMRKRGFATHKTIDLMSVPQANRGDWRPSSQDEAIIKQRITEKILLKPHYYRYYREYKPKEFFLQLLEK